MPFGFILVEVMVVYKIVLGVQFIFATAASAQGSVLMGLREL